MEEVEFSPRVTFVIILVVIGVSVGGLFINLMNTPPPQIASKTSSGTPVEIMVYNRVGGIATEMKLETSMVGMPQSNEWTLYHSGEYDQTIIVGVTGPKSACTIEVIPEWVFTMEGNTEVTLFIEITPNSKEGIGEFNVLVDTKFVS